MSKKLRIILVANSVPLPETDFLKHKIFGLSRIFKLYLLCWGTQSTKQNFCDAYRDKLHDANIHLFYDRLNAGTLLTLLCRNIGRMFLYPSTSIPLLSKLVKNYGWETKHLFMKFTLYFPIVKLKPDIIHFEYGTLARTFSDIKHYVDAKATVSFRGYDLNYVGLDDANYYQTVWNNFDGFHFLGKDLQQRAVKRGYIANKTEALIPPAIDTDFFSPSTVAKNEEKFIIVSVGRLAWKKGYEYGIQAVAILKNKNIPVEYRIIADGDYKQPIQFAIAELGLEKEVILVGGLSAEAIKEELRNAHVFMHPALSEGFSNAVLEAQAMALPVVTSSADGLSENVVDGITGFVVPIYNAQALADKLEWCYQHKKEIAVMGEAGVERVQHHFRIDEQIKKFEDFYKQVDSAR